VGHLANKLAALRKRENELTTLLESPDTTMDAFEKMTKERNDVRYKIQTTEDRLNSLGSYGQGVVNND